MSDFTGIHHVKHNRNPNGHARRGLSGVLGPRFGEQVSDLDHALDHVPNAKQLLRDLDCAEKEHDLMPGPDKTGRLLCSRCHRWIG